MVWIKWKWEIKSILNIKGGKKMGKIEKQININKVLDFVDMTNIYD